MQLQTDNPIARACGVIEEDAFIGKRDGETKVAKAARLTAELVFDPYIMTAFEDMGRHASHVDLDVLGADMEESRCIPVLSGQRQHTHIGAAGKHGFERN